MKIKITDPAEKAESKPLEQAMEFVAPILKPLGSLAARAIEFMKTREQRKRLREHREKLATLMSIAVSTDEGAYLVDKAIQHGQRVALIRQALAEQAAQAKQEEAEESDAIPQGMDPADNDKPATDAELEAFGLKDAPLIVEVLPDGRRILRRQLPINVSLREMKA